jgi:hypothetical protein
MDDPPHRDPIRSLGIRRPAEPRRFGMRLEWWWLGRVEFEQLHFVEF